MSAPTAPPDGRGPAQHAAASPEGAGPPAHQQGPEATPPRRPARKRGSTWRRGLLALAAVAVAGIVVVAISRLGPHKVLHALATARLGWVALGFALMVLAFVMRGISWHEVLRAALPAVPMRWPPVLRAQMIGVMGNALFPGRLGEPARTLLLARRLPGQTRRLVPVIAGTVLSQTIMNLLALAILAVVTFSSVSLFRGHQGGVLIAGALALGLAGALLAGPRLLRLGRRSSHARIARIATFSERLLALARRGLTVFARPRHGSLALAAQLAAWALQWLSCYAVLLALSLQGRAGLAAAAAVLLAVNVSAILPPTPSNVGIFQAACLVVLAAFGVGAGPALAYGVLLQAIEVVTALVLGGLALVGEGISWREVRSAVESERAAEAAVAGGAADTAAGG